MNPFILKQMDADLSAKGRWRIVTPRGRVIESGFKTYVEAERFRQCEVGVKARVERSKKR